MGDLVEITSWPSQKCLFYKVTSSALHFEVQGRAATIVLSEKPEHDNRGFKIILNYQSSVQKLGPDEPNVAAVTADTPRLLSNVEYRGFWVTWFGGSLRVGSAGVVDPFLTLPLVPNHSLPLQYFSFPIDSEPVRCRYVLSPLILAPEKIKSVKGGNAEWIAVDNQLPDNTFIGGYCKFLRCNLYVIRAPFRGSITPGKFVPSEGIGYIPWGGDANETEEFEALCGFNFQWVPTRDDLIPVGAIPGGTSEVRSEVLYIGRAYHEGHLIPGKVQPSHKVCYIPYDGKEVAKKEYEILVDPEQVLQTPVVRLDDSS